MKILLAEQIRFLDKYTIEHEPVTSVALMERAAKHFAEALIRLLSKEQQLFIFCGTGNNGGDGLAVARLLKQKGFQQTEVYVIGDTGRASADFKANESAYQSVGSIKYITGISQMPPLSITSVCIDAIFGTGLSRPVEGLAAAVINAVNQSKAVVYAIDVPSGLYADKANGPDDVVIQSTITFTFHAPKLSFLFPQNGRYVPEFRILDIGLSKQGEAGIETPYTYVTEADVKPFLHKRNKFSHKGTYGHCLICAGSYGKMGAAVLSVSAALRSGAGLVSTLIPQCGYEIMQVTNPEAMVYTDGERNFEDKTIDLKKFNALGCGPGMGTEAKTIAFVEALLKNNNQPMVIDADALNIISAHPHLQDLLTPHSILTPHPGEFKRLAGDWANDSERLQKQIEFSKKYRVLVVLKGANTSISTPAGQVYFNSTGNPGMAKGGSGDVLTGILTALLAQNYQPDKAAIIGVFVHGWAGDYAAAKMGQTAMHAGDIIAHLPEAFTELEAD
jgi:ADP-dependent NAD(P)H-hydrate dehydratase / NAD(P)H-hydrate epimerase